MFPSKGEFEVTYTNKGLKFINYFLLKIRSFYVTSTNSTDKIENVSPYTRFFLLKEESYPKHYNYETSISSTLFQGQMKKKRERGNTDRLSIIKNKSVYL